MSYAALVQDLIASCQLNPQSIVDGEFSLMDASRRNRNIRLQLNGGTSGYFIKIGTDRAKQLTLSHEAEMYRFLRSTLRESTAACLPKVFSFNPERSMLVLEMLDSKNVREIYTTRPRSAPRFTGMIGKALGAVHRELADSGRPDYCETFYPVPFEMWRPSNAFLETCSYANFEFLKILQRSDRLCESLHNLRVHWRSKVESSPQIIHGDIRLDNCCLRLGQRSIRIVDWELAATGDPDWDVGSLMGDLLSGWLISVPFLPGSDPARHAHLAKLPLDLVKAAASQFWSEYVKARRWSPASSRRALRSSVQYAAARLIQLAFEHLHGSSVVTPYAIAHLQVSDNLLARPADGAVLLLGLVA